MGTTDYGAEKPLLDKIEVVAESPVLQTETATVGEVISAQTMQSLPLNGRNPGQLALLLPGAVTPNPDSFASTRASISGGGGRPYVNGNREQTNNYLVDGIDMNETVDNRVAGAGPYNLDDQVLVDHETFACRGLVGDHPHLGDGVALQHLDAAAHRPGVPLAEDVLDALGDPPRLG